MSKHVETNLKGVAEFFGVAYDTVKGWKRNGMPGGGKAGYDLAKIYQWLNDRQSRNKVDRIAEQKRELELRRTMAQIAAVERTNEREEGKLVDRRQVDAEIGILCAEVRTLIERVPTRLQPSLPQKYEHGISAELARLLDSLLNELADKMRRASAVGYQIAQALAEREKASGKEKQK